MMMSFCKKSLQSLWTLTAASPPMRPTEGNNSDHPPTKCGLGLIAAAAAAPMTAVESGCPNTLERAPPLSPPPPFLLPPQPPGPRKIGFFDEVGGGVDGLMSCTESLGFESCDGRTSDEDGWVDEMGSGEYWRTVKKKKKSSLSRENRSFPPPLSTLDRNGHRRFLLQPTRRDGRLELAQVRIKRPEILRASREDGRLRLDLVESSDIDDSQEGDDDRGIIQGGEPDSLELEEKHRRSCFQKSEDVRQTAQECQELREDDQEPGESDQECRETEEEAREREDDLEDQSDILNLCGEDRDPDDGHHGGDQWRLRRCHEMVMSHNRGHHHHHSTHHHLWSQRCVTTS